MTPIEEQEQRRPPGKNFFIPVGTLIGIGAGHPGPGILTGPECSFLSREFIKRLKVLQRLLQLPAGQKTAGFFVAIGFFVIVMGVGSPPRPHISLALCYQNGLCREL
jgi:hypothetical protein